MDTGDGVCPGLDCISAAAEFSAATLHEAAGQQGALPSAIKPVSNDFLVCGPAVTVLSPQKDNLWVHRAIYEAGPGDVRVVDTGGAYEAGYWGEVMTRAGRHRRLGGVVIDGCVRDGERLRELGLPVFARGLCIQGTTKNRRGYGAINCTVSIGGVNVTAGDLIVGDQDGVVVIARQLLAEVLIRAKERQEKESKVIKALNAGESTLDLLDLR